MPSYVTLVSSKKLEAGARMNPHQVREPAYGYGGSGRFGEEASPDPHRGPCFDIVILTFQRVPRCGIYRHYQCPDTTVGVLTGDHPLNPLRFCISPFLSTHLLVTVGISNENESS